MEISFYEPLAKFCGIRTVNIKQIEMFIGSIGYFLALILQISLNHEGQKHGLRILMSLTNYKRFTEENNNIFHSSSMAQDFWRWFLELKRQEKIQHIKDHHTIILSYKFWRSKTIAQFCKLY